MNSDAKTKQKKLRGIKSRISQRSWRHPENTRHHKHVLYQVPPSVKEEFRKKCHENQESMRDAVIKLMRFYVWNKGVPKMPKPPKYKKTVAMLVMCIPETTKFCFKAQCINQMESLPFAFNKLVRYYVLKGGIPDGPTEPAKITRNDPIRDERRRTFDIARRNLRVKTARSSLD